jgi:hypothetical protein
MIDPDLIDGNLLAQQGLSFLAESGVLRAQQQRLAERVTHGDADEADASLLESIRRFRREARNLESLQELGDNYREGDK